jgi:hypothetical protein
LKALLLSQKQIDKYGKYFTKYSMDVYPDYSYQALQDDSVKLKNSVIRESFSHDNTGFTSKIYSERDTLAFYSVPWEEGWSAKVNGKDADIEKVDVGFMAVKINKGWNTVRFNYMTPGLINGLLITGGGVVVFAGYLYFWYRRRKNTVMEYSDTFVFAEDEYFTECVPDEDDLLLPEELPGEYDEQLAFEDLKIQPEQTEPEQIPTENQGQEE